MKAIRFTVTNYMMVYSIIFTILVGGIYSYIVIPREAAPDVVIPVVMVSTVYEGVSPSDVETLVTDKLESKLEGLDKVKKMSSTSSEGLSIISIEFDISVDIDNAISRVRDRVDKARPDLPVDVKESEIIDIRFSDVPVMIVSLSGDYGFDKLKSAGRYLRDKLKDLPGVIDVNLQGAQEDELRIDIDPERLKYYKLSVNAIKDAIEKENVTTPGGSIDLAGYKYLVRIPGEYKDPLKIGDIVVRSKDKERVYIKDLANVYFAPKKRDFYSRLNGVESVSLYIKKRSSYNVLEVADSVYHLLHAQKKNLPSGSDIKITSDLAKETRIMVDDLESNIITTLLVIVTILFFSLGLRISLFVLLAIPLSFLITFGVLFFAGYTFNNVSMFSLIISLGLLVDNSIVVIENIYKHMERGEDSITAAIDGASEVASPIIYSTLTTLAAFIPLIFWPGVMGEFMQYLPITLIIILTASLFVALVVNPVLCAIFLKVDNRGLFGSSSGSASQAGSTSIYLFYTNLLHKALANRKKSLLAVTVIFFVVVFSYPLLGKGLEFFPLVDPKIMFVGVEFPSGTNVERVNEVALQVEKKLLEEKDIATYLTNIGSSVVTDYTQGPARKGILDIAIEFIDKDLRHESSRKTANKIRGYLDDIDLEAKFSLKELEGGPPSGAPINIELSGDDFATIARVSKDIRSILDTTEGLINQVDDYSIGKPEILIKVDREAARDSALSTIEIASTLRAAINGIKAGSYRDGEDDEDIVIRYSPETVDTIGKIENLFIPNFKGEFIPLSSVANLDTVAGYNDIRHINSKKSITISSGVDEDQNAIERLGEVQKRIASEIELPPGSYISYTGQNEEAVNSSIFMLKAMVVALLLITFLLLLEFNSLLVTVGIMSTVVLSTIGVLVGLMIMRLPFGIIMSGIGVISLSGVVVNNAIVYVDHLNSLIRSGIRRDEAIIMAGKDRLRPIALTAITTILGLSTMIFGVSIDFFKFRLIFDSEMSQWWSQMATAIAFGLGFSTLLTLVVMPVIYSTFDRIIIRFTSTNLVGEKSSDI